jgi:hypothetical protein
MIIEETEIGVPVVTPRECTDLGGVSGTYRAFNCKGVPVRLKVSVFYSTTQLSTFQEYHSVIYNDISGGSTKHAVITYLVD